MSGETTLSSSSATGIPIRNFIPWFVINGIFVVVFKLVIFISNYSLSKLGGSFMEKWKNSFGSVSSTSGVALGGSGIGGTTGVSVTGLTTALMAVAKTIQQQQLPMEVTLMIYIILVSEHRHIR